MISTTRVKNWVGRGCDCCCLVALAIPVPFAELARILRAEKYLKFGTRPLLIAETLGPHVAQYVEVFDQNGNAVERGRTVRDLFLFYLARKKRK